MFKHTLFALLFLAAGCQSASIVDEEPSQSRAGSGPVGSEVGSQASSNPGEPGPGGPAGPAADPAEAAGPAGSQPQAEPKPGGSKWQSAEEARGRMAKSPVRVHPAFDNPPDVKKDYVAAPAVSTAALRNDTDNNTNELFHPDGAATVPVR